MEKFSEFLRKRALKIKRRKWNHYQSNKKNHKKKQKPATFAKKVQTKIAK